MWTQLLTVEKDKGGQGSGLSKTWEWDKVEECLSEIYLIGADGVTR